jgi:hypothetical protein
MLISVAFYTFVRAPGTVKQHPAACPCKESCEFGASSRSLFLLLFLTYPFPIHRPTFIHSHLHSLILLDLSFRQAPRTPHPDAPFRISGMHNQPRIVPHENAVYQTHAYAYAVPSARPPRNHDAVPPAYARCHTTHIIRLSDAFPRTRPCRYLVSLPSPPRPSRRLAHHRSALH